MKDVSSFNSLHGFWQHWNYLPHSNPWGLFTNPDTHEQPMIYPDKRPIEAVGIFQTGTSPAWEDPLNAGGCDISIRKNFPQEHLKDSWDKLVFSVIGESLQFAEEIVGCRVVDKGALKKFEIWLKTDCYSPPGQEKVNAIRTELHERVFTYAKLDELRVSSHRNRSVPVSKHSSS